MVNLLKDIISIKNIYKECLVYEKDILIETDIPTKIAIRYGNYLCGNVIENNNKQIEVHLISPIVSWRETLDSLELIGFTNIKIIDEDMSGFYTYCVGNSFEAGDIYIDVLVSVKNGQLIAKPIEQTDTNFVGRGNRDIPIYLPDKIINLVKEASINNAKNNPLFIDYLDNEDIKEIE